MARRFGARIAIDPTAVDAVDTIKRLTEGRGADVAIEALGSQISASTQGNLSLRTKRSMRAWEIRGS